MGSFSLFHWLILIAIVAVVIFLASRGSSPKPQHIKVGSKAELFGAVQKYAAQGYQTVMDRGHIIVMNKKIPFNWFLFIVLLFIPIIGWIALLVLLFANKNKISSVTIEAPENA
ncbi:hypothetical protein [Rhizobium sp. KDH_Rht_773_N]|jgi:hypothetical protein